MSENLYLVRYAYPISFISTPPSSHVGIIVVIPVFRERRLRYSLRALQSCDFANCEVEVIIVINEAENCLEEISEINRNAFEECKTMAESSNSAKLKFHPIYVSNISAKSHGVGIARKIGMDEAARRFVINGIDGLILGFDADCSCEENYFKEIENYFESRPKCPGASIYFEHPLEDIADPLQRTGIVQYELHLRYMVNALRYSRFPYAHHTVGSSMVVRASAYMKQGGMNRKQAGEDFYFLNKIMHLGNFGELTSTVIYPSPRISDRVPFGTGKSMQLWMAAGNEHFLTYPPNAYRNLKILFEHVPHIYSTGLKVLDELPEEINVFLASINAKDHIAHLLANTASLETFKPRFFRYFDAFKVVKYLNYYAHNYESKIPVTEAASWLLENLEVTNLAPGYKDKDSELLLSVFRKIDRMGITAYSK